MLVLMVYQTTFMRCHHYNGKIHVCDCYNTVCFSWVGKEDCLKPVDPSLWAQCMLEESVPQPSFYSPEFKENIEYLLYSFHSLNICDVTHQNCVNIYMKLVNIVDSLIY